MSSFKKFLLARISPEGVLGLHVTMGILVLLGATWLFGAIADAVINQQRLTEIDAEVTRVVQTFATRHLTFVLLIITHLHSTIVASIFAVAMTAYFLRKRLKYWALAFPLAVGGGMLLNLLLKNVFQRARPSFDVPILTLTSYGFPSGHTMLATTLYGALCVFIISRVGSWQWRAVTIQLSAFMIMLVGFSRIYLGAHYLSDVLAAIAEGLAWLALTLTAVHTMRRWRERQRHRAEDDAFL